MGYSLLATTYASQVQRKRRDYDPNTSYGQVMVPVAANTP
jgi:hypothetical protein